MNAIHRLSYREISLLRDMLTDALDNGRTVRLASDEGTVKAKVGEDGWTPPLGTPEK